VEKRCRVLSGGEKARLVMAKMLYDPPNFLVLDEPTHHLDIATKAMLIGARSQYEGAMLFWLPSRNWRRDMRRSEIALRKQSRRSDRRAIGTLARGLASFTPLPAIGDGP